MKPKYFFWFLIVLVISIIIFQKSNREDLYRNYELSSGRIVHYQSWRTRKVEFKIDNLILEQNASMGIIFPGCGDLIRENFDKLKALKFPVIYSKDNVLNHEILIFRKQYEKAGLEIPDSLQSIVYELSACFN